MFIPSDALSVSTLARMPGSSFALGGRDKLPMWIIGEGDNRLAVFLGGAPEYRWHFLRAAGNTSWTGSYLEPVRLEVDPWRTVGPHEAGPGAVKIGDGHASISTLGLVNGDDDEEWLAVDDCPKGLNNAHFNHWRLVHGERGSAFVLVAYDAGTLTFPAVGL